MKNRLYDKLTTWLNGLLLLTMLGAALPIAAQSVAPFQKRIYVGVGLTRTEYVTAIRVRGGPGLDIAGQLQPTLGFYILPRLALQASFSHRYVTGSRSEVGTLDDGTPIANYHEGRTSFYAIPILAQYTISKPTDRGWGVDALVGLTLCAGEENIYGTYVVAGKVVGRDAEHARISGTLLTVGVGARYAFNSHLEAISHFAVNRNVEQITQVAYQTMGIRWGLTTSFGVGLRYRFNLGQPKPAAE